MKIPNFRNHTFHIPSITKLNTSKFEVIIEFTIIIATTAIIIIIIFG